MKITNVEGREFVIVPHNVTYVAKDDRRPEFTVVKLSCGATIRTKMSKEIILKEIFSRIH